VLAIRDMTKDLSERIERRTQTIKRDLARAAQEDRLTSLGRLVASVCHEINNPITSIVTFTKLVLSIIRKGNLPSEEIANVERYLDLSFREAMRCGGIVKNLLTFARPKSVEVKNIDIAEVVNTIRLLADHQFELSNIHCVVNLPSPPFAAWGDHTQIQQCLLNLIFNAIDAMPDGGTLTISGGTDESTDLIWLAVSDTGQGIESNDLQRIFEPFYSTKTEGKGVGLGLSMVYGIIHEHNGVVEVDSEPGKGTTFRIKLPRSPLNGIEGEQILNGA
jgi:two-component system, NtrC family, sensor kinase